MNKYIYIYIFQEEIYGINVDYTLTLTKRKDEQT